MFLVILHAWEYYLTTKHAMASEQSLSPSVSTPEYDTMCKCYPTLVSLIKESPNTIGDALFSDGYIIYHLM